MSSAKGLFEGLFIPGERDKPIEEEEIAIVVVDGGSKDYIRLSLFDVD